VGDAPAGRWTILRFGRSLTGAKNRPAVPAALGYKVDKLSRAHVEQYMRDYTAPIARALGPLWGTSVHHVLLDSWEAGIQNWTDSMLVEFRARRGYDPTPYLPALAGRVVESAEVSDRFLWDFRRTLVDMFAENHYGTATRFLHAQGIQTYSEASGVSLEPLEDALLNKKQVDIPMGEFWFRSLHPRAMYYADVRGAYYLGQVASHNPIFRQIGNLIDTGLKFSLEASATISQTSVGECGISRRMAFAESKSRSMWRSSLNTRPL